MVLEIFLDFNHNLKSVLRLPSRIWMSETSKMPVRTETVLKYVQKAKSAKGTTLLVLARSSCNFKGCINKHILQKLRQLLYLAVF